MSVSPLIASEISTGAGTTVVVGFVEVAEASSTTTVAADASVTAVGSGEEMGLDPPPHAASETIATMAVDVAMNLTM